jgi:hypothetical protein
MKSAFVFFLLSLLTYLLLPYSYLAGNLLDYAYVQCFISALRESFAGCNVNNVNKCNLCLVNISSCELLMNQSCSFHISNQTTYCFKHHFSQYVIGSREL